MSLLSSLPSKGVTNEQMAGKNACVSALSLSDPRRVAASGRLSHCVWAVCLSAAGPRGGLAPRRSPVSYPCFQIFTGNLVKS